MRRLISLALVCSLAACIDTERPRPSGNDPDAGSTNPPPGPPPPPPGTDAGSQTQDDSGANPPPMNDAGSSTTPDTGAQGFPDAEPRTGLAVLGWNSHAVASVNLEVISQPSDGLNVPRDLAFNPEHANELWVVNRADDSTVTYLDVGTMQQQADKRIDPYALHFMEEVSSIAFGQPGRFATCQETRNTYNNQAPPDDFMGPSLWPSDLSIYGFTNPEAVNDIGFDLGSHVDMLHESPYCMGIAWETANVYWTFDGMAGSISRYDFQRDHGPGYDDHSDGIIQMFSLGVFSRVPNVPSHLERDPASGLLYIADTGNQRIAVLDATNATTIRNLREKEPGTQFIAMGGETVTTLVDGVGGELSRPSGLALSGSTLFVTDNMTSRISAFDLSGQRIDYLDTGLPSGALMGIVADAEGRLWIVDAVQNRVLRISPKD